MRWFQRWAWGRRDKRHALARLRRPFGLGQARPGLRKPRKNVGFPLRATPAEAVLPAVGDTSFVQAVRTARRGPVVHAPQVELAAITRARVRKAPALLVNALLLVLATDLAGSLYLREAMGVKLLDRYRDNLVPPSQSVVSDQEGERVGTLAAPEAVREPIDEVPAVFSDALVRWEDARFYAHDGVDRYRIAGAFAALLHGDPQGGSTLTMQLAKLIKKDSARTLRRKMEDIALALALDDRLGKDEVLKYYANQAYFGSGVYGIGQACKYYFEKPRCQSLDLNQAAYLVSLLRAPADLSRDERRAWARRNAVMEQMREPEPPGDKAARVDQVSRRLFLAVHAVVDHGVAGRNELAGKYAGSLIDQQRATPLDLARHKEPPTHPFVLETARQELQKRLGPSLYEDGLEIRLTINSEVQRAAEKALAIGLDNLKKLRAERGKDTEKDLDGGVVVIDPRTGHLLAYVPGADFHQSQVPFAARPIQIGSSIKPFIYAELFEQGKGDLDTIIPDAPICFGGWCPQNYDHKYHGPVAVQFALSHSLNTVAVRIADKVGVDAIASRLRLLGVQSPLSANLPMALGASELTLLELGQLYSALYDGHVPKEKLVLDVKSRTGEVLYGGDEPLRPQVYQPRTIQNLHTAMAGVLQPGGTAGSIGKELEEYFGVPKDEHLGQTPGLSPQMACKTGTHDGFTRVGLGCVISDTDFGPVAIVTYVGHRTPRPLGEGLTGGKIAGPIMSSLVRAMTVRTRAAGAFRPFPDNEQPYWEKNGPAPELDGVEVPPLAKAEVAPTPVAKTDDEKDDEPSAPNDRKSLGEEQRKALAQALAERKAADPGLAAHSYARAGMAAPERAPDQASSPSVVDPTRAQLPSEGQQLTAQGAEAAEAPRLGAPRDWPGLRVLDTDVVEAAAPELIKTFLDAGGHEEELAELAPLLDMSIDRRVVHQHRLLDKGFTERPLSERLLLLGDKIASSLARMLNDKQTATTYEHPAPGTFILAEADGDRRIERVYTFPHPPQMFRVTRHHTSGQLLALEWVDEDGVRRAVVRRGERMSTLTARRVVVKGGALEQAWLAGGMSPSSLDGLRSLIGAAVNIDRIPRGFELQLLLADASLVGVEATRPGEHVEDAPLKVSAIRTEGACLSQDGVPCARRLLPLPLAEARVYTRRGQGNSGNVLIQKDVPGALATAPVHGRVVSAVDERGLVVIDPGDGRVVRLEGLRPSVQSDQYVRAGEPLGRLDPRGVLVYKPFEAKDGGDADPIDAIESLAEVGSADDALRGVSGWWREVHAWLRGERPVLRKPAATAQGS